MGGRGPRTLETMCTVCETVVGVKVHWRSQQVDDYRVARHRVPGSERNRSHADRLPICSGSGIVVSEAVTIPVASCG